MSFVYLTALLNSLSSLWWSLEPLLEIAVVAMFLSAAEDLLMPGMMTERESGVMQTAVAAGEWHMKPLIFFLAMLFMLISCICESECNICFVLVPSFWKEIRRKIEKNVCDTCYGMENFEGIFEDYIEMVVDR